MTEADLLRENAELRANNMVKWERPRTVEAALGPEHHERLRRSMMSEPILPPAAKLLTRDRRTTILVDDSDYAFLSTFKWRIDRYGCPQTKIRKANGTVSLVRIHRLLLSPSGPDIQIDHVNHNVLDNRRSNLRLCSGSQNLGNRRAMPFNTTGYKGVSRDRNRHQFRAVITIGRRQKHLGYFDNAEAAGAAYDDAALRVFGEFALTNSAIRARGDK